MHPNKRQGSRIPKKSFDGFVVKKSIYNYPDVTLVMAIPKGVCLLRNA